MTQQPTELFGAITPVFEELSLITQSGTKIDLAPMLSNLTIYEDLFSPVLTGSITIEDKINLFQNLPIIGNERLAVKIYSWNYSLEKNKSLDFLHRTFDITRITDIIHINDYTQQLTLHFASPELKKNECFRISRGFYDVTNSDIIESILTDDFDSDDPQGLGFSKTPIPQAEKYENIPILEDVDIHNHFCKLDDEDSVELFIEKTAYVEPVLSFPYYKPFDLIQWISGRSLRYKNSESANFLFFENKRGFQFVSMDTLFENRDLESKTTFIYGNAAQNKHSGNTRKVFTERINKLQIQDCYSIIENLRSGVYASKLYSYDLLTGHTNEYDYSYLDNFDKSESLDQYPILRSNEQDLTTRFLSKRMISIHSPAHDINTITSECTERCNIVKTLSGADEYLQKRLSQIARLSNYRVLFEISANSKHKVGDVVELDIKNIEYSNKNISSDFEEKSNKYYSGNYLISSIKHTITKFEYVMSLECIKESYANKFE